MKKSAMKKILIVSWSQTGQLADVVKAVAEPLITEAGMRRHAAARFTIIVQIVKRWRGETNGYSSLGEPGGA